MSFSRAAVREEILWLAVVSDLVQAAQYGAKLSARPQDRAVIPHVLSSDLERPQYLRFVVKDRPGIIAAVAEVLSRYHINLDAVLQRPGYCKSELPFVVTLEPCKESRVEAALAEIAKLDFMVEPRIRMPILS